MSEQAGPWPLAPRYHLRLFIAGTTLRSMHTIENLRTLMRTHLEGRVELEVVDIYQQPELAEAGQIMAAPTLLKLSPAPLRRITGDLSDEARVLRALDLLPPVNDDG